MLDFAKERLCVRVTLTSIENALFDTAWRAVVKHSGNFQAVVMPGNLGAQLST